MSSQRDRKWDFASEDDLLYGYMGSGYRNTEDDMARIAHDKAVYDAPHVAKMLALQPDDIVVDLGSGYGHVAKVLAPQVKFYYCCDISARMLEKCVAITSGIGNVAHVLLERANLGPLYGKPITKLFANSVFIHLDMFDITLYLEEAAKVLPVGGKFYFNLQDADILALEDDPNFASMRDRYLADPQEITLMRWNSLQAVRGYARRRGFAFKESWVWLNCATSVTFEKVAG